MSSDIHRILMSDLPPDAPGWAKQLVETVNANAEVLDELKRVNRAPKPVQKDLTFTTTTPATDTFVPALKISLPFVPSLVKIGRVQNRTDPLAPAVFGVHLDWAKVEGGILVRAIVGLDDATAYVVTIEASP